MVLDAFGRSIESYVTPSDGPEVQVGSTVYDDFALPPYHVTYAYTEAGQADSDAVRTAEVSDGFGGVWKRIRQADVPTANKYVGTALYHRSPANNESAETYELACADPLCSNVTGASELAAVVSTRDGLGRVVSVESPDGFSYFHYDVSVESVVQASGSVGSQAVDVVLEQSPKGDLTRRSMDGSRLMAVDECTNSDPNRTLQDLNLSLCVPGGQPRTLYGYHPNGQLGSIFDPLGNELRYYFDTAGQVSRIDDPDGGTSVTFYDDVGNVSATHKVDAQEQFQQSRSYAYDALNRLVSITTPSGELDYTLTYRSGEMQLGTETTSAFLKSLSYDGFGRVSRDQRGELVANYQHDLLGRRVFANYNDTNAAVLYHYEGDYLKSICNGDEVNGCAGGEPVLIEDVRYDDFGRRSEIDVPGGTASFGTRRGRGDT